MKRLAAPLGAVLALFLLRFHALVAGGVLTFRDAGYFFGPWREVFARQVRAGIPPVWNDAASCGRAFAANPNAGVFWPLTWIVPFAGTTGLVLVDFALLLLATFAALRMLRLPAWASACGAVVVLFSGVAQSLPIVFTSLASLVPVPLALAAVATVEPGSPGARRRSLLAGACLGLSYLGGEPVITLCGALACGAIAAVRAFVERREPHRAARRVALFALTAAATVGIAAVQLFPAVGELRRSDRAARMRPEHGALYWSVEPSRALTLLEPRLTGDPFADDAADYWGAGTFDAGNPYFYDLALGLVPLVLALAAFGDPRGRGALGVAALGAVLACGRHVPGYRLVAPAVAIFRYPEKWWAVSTLALAAAAAVALDAIADPTRRSRTLRLVRGVAAALAAALLALAGLGAAAPGALRGLVFAWKLGAGPVTAERLSSILTPFLAAGGVSLLVLATLAELARRERLRLGTVAAAAALLFLLDAGRRVAGTVPVSPPELLKKETPASRAVVAALDGGRFYDDGSERADVAVARAKEADGYDPLRPETGILAGIRYAGESDVDRMTPARAMAWARDTAALPWGEAKAARLRSAGVRVIRTPASPPDPAGVVEVARTSTDRILRLTTTRPELALVASATFVPFSRDPAAIACPDDPLVSAIVESDAAPGPRAFSTGSVEIVSDAPHRTRARVSAAGPALLVVARSFDPSWRAFVDGTRVPLRRADGFLSAVEVPAGAHEVELRYVNPLLVLGMAATLASAVAIALAARPARS